MKVSELLQLLKHVPVSADVACEFQYFAYEGKDGDVYETDVKGVSGMEVRDSGRTVVLK